MIDPSAPGIRSAHIRLALLLPMILIGLRVHPAAAQGASDEERARGFIGSIAAGVYNAAWPTADYEGFRLKKVEGLDDGLAVLVRLTGESAFGGELWLDLVFEFRADQLFDMRISSHNAILVPPFETAKALASLTMDLAREFSDGVNAPVEARPPPDHPTARRERPMPAEPARAQVLPLPRDDGTQRVHLRRPGRPERVLEQPFDAGTSIGAAGLETIRGMELVGFYAADRTWLVRYWWNLDVDELFYVALDRSGAVHPSPNFEGPAGSVADRMRRFVLEPWLDRRRRDGQLEP